MGDRAVFLDRDGTIAKDVHYCSCPEDFEIFPRVPEAIRLLSQNGFKVVVITNQSGIARGYFSEETLSDIHQKLKDDLAKQGAKVDAIYYCPHHPDEGCACRKPGVALFHRAAQELNISFDKSYVVGDLDIDIEAGTILKCKTVMVTTGPNGGKDVVKIPDYVADDLLVAARWILMDTGYGT